MGRPTKRKNTSKRFKKELRKYIERGADFFGFTHRSHRTRKYIGGLKSRLARRRRKENIEAQRNKEL